MLQESINFATEQEPQEEVVKPGVGMVIRALKNGR